MRSIKIKSNRHSPTKRQQFQPEQAYEAFIKVKPNASLRQKIMSIFAEMCYIIEQKTPVKLDLSANIRKWLQKNDERQDQTLEQFRFFLLQTIENLIKNNENWQKNNDKDKVKIIRIKSEQRIKLRLLKQNQSPTGELWQTDVLKEEQSKQQQIYQLKKANKSLQRKIVLLSAQFNQIKKAYESKIEKYKKLLYSSLINLQKQLGQDIGSIPERQNYNWSNQREFNNKKQSLGELNYEQGLRSARSQQSKRFGSAYNNQNLAGQQPYRFATIPMIPPFQDDRRLSHKHYGSQ